MFDFTTQRSDTFGRRQQPQNDAVVLASPGHDGIFAAAAAASAIVAAATSAQPIQTSIASQCSIKGIRGTCGR